MKVKLALTGLLFCCLLFVILQARQEFFELPVGSQSRIQKVFSAATLDLNSSNQHFQAAPGNEIDFINPVLPKVVACGETALAVIDVVKLNTGKTSSSMQLSIALDKGLRFSGQFFAVGCTGIQSNVKFRNDLSTAQNIVFDFPDMQTGVCSMIKFSFGLKVDCEVIQIINTNPNEVFNWSYKMNYTGGFDSKEESPIPINKPKLTITDPGSAIASPGSILTRSFTICQTGVDAYLLDSLIINDFGASDINIKGVKINGGVENSQYISGLPGNQTITIPASEFVNATLSGTNNLGNSNTKFDGPEGGNPNSKAECLVITEVIEINGCKSNSLSSQVVAGWGCGGNICQYSDPVNPNISIEISGGPKLTISEEVGSELCLGRSYQHSVTVQNEGTSIATNIDFDVYLWSNTIDQLADCNGGSLDSNAFQISINNGNFQSIKPIKNQTKNCNGFLSCYTQDIVLGSTLRLPEMRPNDRIEIRYTKKLCCPSSTGYYNASGDAIKADYMDRCGNLNNILPTLVTDQIFFTKGEISNETPGAFRDGVFSELTLIYRELIISNYNANSLIELEITLPPGFSWSGNISDIMWTDAARRVWQTKSLNFNNGVIRARFNVQELQTMLFSKVNSEIKLKNLVLDCNQLGSANPLFTEFGVEVKFFPDPNNCDCEIPLASNKVINEIFCPIINNDQCRGVFFYDFDVKRTTYGLQDSNDDELPDNNNIADPNIDPIKTIRAMAGDEITARYSGVIEDTVDVFPMHQYLYAESNFPSASEMIVANASAEIYDASRNVVIHCQDIKSEYLGNDVWKFDLSRPAILAAGCADPNLAGFGGYEKNDTVKLKVIYRINKNIPNVVVENLMLNRLYVSSIPDPVNDIDKKQCYNRFGRFIYIGYYLTNNGIPAVFEGCENDFVAVNFEYHNIPTSTSTGSNLFPFEYRPQIVLDQMEVKLPAGYSYVSSEAVLSVGRGSGIPVNLRANVAPVNPNVSNLVFDLRPLFKSNNPNGPWDDPDDAFIVEIRVFINPDCQVPKISKFSGRTIASRRGFLLNIPANGNNTEPIDNEDQVLDPSNTAFNLTFVRPHLALQSSNQTVNGITSNFNWPLNIYNTAANTQARNVWLYFKNPSGQIAINELKIGNTKINASAGGFFQLGNLTSQGGQLNLEINGSSNFLCNLDSVIVYAGWNCVGYPTQFEADLCDKAEYTLYIKPFSTNMSITSLLPIENASKIYKLCENIEFVVQVDNIGQSNASNIDFDFIAPPGFEYIPDSTYIEYRIKSVIPPSPNVRSGNWRKIGNPVIVGNDPLGVIHRFDITKQWNAATGQNTLGGVNGSLPYTVINPDSSKFYIRFMAKARCGFNPGTRIPYRVSAQSTCQLGSNQKEISITEFSVPINSTNLKDPNYSNITCPPNITIASGPDCSVIVSWIEPAPKDLCNPVTVKGTHKPGDRFNIGTTTVSYTGTDACGNQNTCSFTITVTENCCNNKPIITCPANISGCPGGSIHPDITGYATARPLISTCLPPIMTYTDRTIYAGPCKGAIKIERTWRAAVPGIPTTFSECIQTIEYKDDIAPVFTSIPKNITIQVFGACDGIATWVDPIATDKCGGVTITSNRSSGSKFLVGVTKVVFTATDLCGNTSTASMLVNVDGNEIEVFCPNDTTVFRTNVYLNGTYYTWPLPTVKYCTPCIDSMAGFIYMGEYNGHRYFCSKAAETWNTAKLICELNGGKLAIMNDAQENQFLSKKLMGQTAWIGGTDARIEGVFEWHDRTPFVYTNWKKGEPNKLTSNDDYIEMFPDGTWNDQDGKVSREFVCEFTCFDLTQIAGPKRGTLIPCGNSIIKYEALKNGKRDTCEFNVNIDCDSISKYCNTRAENSQLMWIQNVTIANINNTSGDNNGYKYFNTNCGQLSNGQKTSIWLTPGFKATTYNVYWKAWIDYNADGFFSNNELIITGSGKNTINANVTVPNKLLPRLVRMRVMMSYGTYPAGECSKILYGEVEDYCISINGGTSFSNFLNEELESFLTPNDNKEIEIKEDYSIGTELQTYRPINPLFLVDILPNPANNEITLHVNQGDIQSVFIYDIYGNEVIKMQDQQHVTYLFDVSNWNNGVYVFVMRNTKGEQLVKRIVVQH